MNEIVNNTDLSFRPKGENLYFFKLDQNFLWNLDCIECIEYVRNYCVF